MRGSRVFALVGAMVVAALSAATPARATPTVTLEQPAELNPQSVSGVAGLGAGDAKSVTIDFFPGGSATGAAAASALAGRTSTGAFSAAVPQLRDGIWTAQATQADSTGSSFGVSEQRTFRIDVRGPEVELTAPDAVIGESVPHFEGVAGTTEGDIPDITLTVTGAGERTTIGASVRGAGFSASAPEALPDGTYTVVASQADDLGHVGTSSRTFVIDTTPPVVTAPPPETATVAGTPPPASPAPALPQPVPAKLKRPAGLKLTSATASRRGRTITLKLRGTAAKAAGGRVAVKVAGVRKTAKLSKGTWRVTLKLRTKARSLKVTVTYGGDGGFTAGTAKRSVRL